MTFSKGIIKTEIKKNAEDEKEIYQMYYDFQEQVSKIAHHRVLAVNRGEKEKVLRVTIEPPVENVISYLQKEIHYEPGYRRSEYYSGRNRRRL